MFGQKATLLLVKSWHIFSYFCPSLWQGFMEPQLGWLPELRQYEGANHSCLWWSSGSFYQTGELRQVWWNLLTAGGQRRVKNGLKKALQGRGTCPVWELEGRLGKEWRQWGMILNNVPTASVVIWSHCISRESTKERSTKKEREYKREKTQPEGS